ncbi:MAG: S26 family signal peptidase [Clostridiales bacterium]|nr:S26 family signal peptidase [Clostridiales bacterium]
MLYKAGLFRKEWSYAYYENPNGMRTLVALGVFQGMMAFALFFVLQTLRESVLSEKVPYIIETSNFSTIFIYLGLSYLSMTAYFIVRYQNVSYAEVYDNSWYALVHMKYPVGIMVIAKLLAQLAYVLLVYAIGFVVTIGLTSFLKAPFVLPYLISQFLQGAMNLAMLLSITLTVSLSIRDVTNAKYAIGAFSLAAGLLQLPTGYFQIISDRSKMQSLSNLLLPSGGSLYAIGLLVFCAVSLIYCIVRAMDIAKRFNPPYDSGIPVPEAKWGEGVRLTLHTARKDRKILAAVRRMEKAALPKQRSTALSFIATGLLVAVVTGMLLINVLLLAFNYASPTKETAIMGYFPYIFQSSTMEPTIHFNDIAFFEKIDEHVALSQGDIVLFKDKVGAVQVRRAMSLYTDEEFGYQMIDGDIDYYPPDAIPDVMKITFQASSVYGRLVGVNRYLGVIILFANTVLGRMLFLIVPTILIFYSGQIRKFFKGLALKQRR